MSSEKQQVEDITKALVDILTKSIKVSSEDSSKTELYRDFGLAGDDVDDFLKEIEKKFDVNMSAFEIWRYFPDEGAMITDWPLKLVGVKTRLDVSNYQSLSVTDLAKYVFKLMKTTKE